MHILAVDDEQHGLNLLSRSIQKALPDAMLLSFRSSDDALEYARENPTDVAFLDVQMPGTDGLTLAIELKKLNPKVNIIFVTGYREYAEDAFAIHASGYVHKPVSPGAVLEQIENLRFTPASPPEPLLQLGIYTFDHTALRVYAAGKDTLLKPREYHLFCLLATHPEQFFSPEVLYQKIWGDDSNGNVNTVYVHVSSLRKKLRMGTLSGYTIERKRGLGYRLTRNIE